MKQFRKRFLASALAVAMLLSNAATLAYAEDGDEAPPAPAEASEPAPVEQTPEESVVADTPPAEPAEEAPAPQEPVQEEPAPETPAETEAPQTEEPPAPVESVPEAPAPEVSAPVEQAPEVVAPPPQQPEPQPAAPEIQNSAEEDASSSNAGINPGIKESVGDTEPVGAEPVEEELAEEPAETATEPETETEEEIEPEFATMQALGTNPISYPIETIANGTFTIEVNVFNANIGRVYIGTDTIDRGSEHWQGGNYQIPPLSKFTSVDYGRVEKVVGTWTYSTEKNVGANVQWSNNTNHGTMTYWVTGTGTGSGSGDGGNGGGSSSSSGETVGGGSGRYSWNQSVVYHANYPGGSDPQITVNYSVKGNYTSMYNMSAKSYADCGFSCPDGYSVDYWYTAASGGTKRNNVTLEQGKGTIHYYAHYTATSPNQGVTEYTITYKDGDDTLATDAVPAGQSTEVLGPFEKEGCEFKGWATSKDGNVTYNPGDKFTPNGNLTLYAVWEENTPEPLPTVQQPTKGGIALSVKFTDETGKHSFSTYGINYSNNYAEISWNNVSETATVTVHGGYYLDTVINKGSVTHRFANGEQADKTVTINWDATQSKWIPDVSVVEFKVTCAEEVTESTFTLQYDKNAGSDTVTGMPQPNPVDITEVSKQHTFILDKTATPLREGYTFKGWGNAPDATSPVNSLVCNPGETVTAYAIWEKNATTDPGTTELTDEKVKELISILVYDMSEDENKNSIHGQKRYDLVDGTFTVSGPNDGSYTVTVVKDQYVTKYNGDVSTVHTLVNTDNATAEVKKNESGEWKVVGSNGLVDSTNISVGVKCETETPPDHGEDYTVTFDANGGDLASQQVTVHDDDTTDDKHPTVGGSMPEEPKRSGYVFDGWYTAPGDGEGTPFKGDTAVTGDTTVYAHWKEDKDGNGTPDEDEELTVTFKVQGGTWADGSSSDKTAKVLPGMSLTDEQIPKPGDHDTDHIGSGKWDTTPSTDTEITKDTIYTYTFDQPQTEPQPASKVQYMESDDDEDPNYTADIDGDTTVLTPAEAGVSVPDGQQLDHWVDQNGNTYTPGEQLIPPDGGGDLVLRPVWTPTTTGGEGPGGGGTTPTEPEGPGGGGEGPGGGTEPEGPTDPGTPGGGETDPGTTTPDEPGPAGPTEPGDVTLPATEPDTPVVPAVPVVAPAPAAIVPVPGVVIPADATPLAAAPDDGADADADAGDDADDGAAAAVVIDDNDTPLAGGPDDGNVANIEDNDTPLASLPGDIDQACCILHLLIMLVALGVTAYYTHNRKKHQEDQFDLRRELAMA